jgi:hypothetical protein
MITGVWKGKINRQKVEVKIIQDGDSLRGTSYYYESPARYTRYSIKGYFDPNTNEAVWWDDQLIEEKPASQGRGKMAMLSRADFNCPGGGKMMLDGKAGRIQDDPRGEVHLDKIEEGIFADEWNFVIDNYLVGGNDYMLLDSISGIATNNSPREEPMVFIQQPVEKPEPISPVIVPPKKEVPVIAVAPPRTLTIEEKYYSRKKTLTTEIPISGDSIELRFYDNAEIDGDSISLFLNDKLIYSNIRLTGNAYVITIPVNELGSNNELIMVAENLGSIPPNTSYMVAIVNEKRYEARLESNEGSSAMVRFVKN